MTSQKYNPPTSPPPPAYGGDGTYSNINSPSPAHVAPQTESYGASPYQNSGPPPQQDRGAFWGPAGPGIQQPQVPQGGYYGPQAGYQQPGYGPGYYPQQGPYGPQGGYYNNGRAGNAGFMEACLASLACCCCLDACLMF